MVRAEVRFNMRNMMLGVEEGQMPYEWKPDMPTKLHLVSLADGAVTTYELPACFAFSLLPAPGSRVGHGQRRTAGVLALRIALQCGSPLASSLVANLNAFSGGRGQKSFLQLL